MEGDTQATPQLVRDAFAPLAVLRVADLPLQPLSVGTMILLEQLDSPLIKQAPKGGKLKSATLMDLGSAALVMTRDECDTLALLQGERKVFDREVMTLVKKIPARELQDFGEQVRRHIEAAFATAIPAGAPEEKKTAATPTSPPSTISAPAAPASAGR